MSKYGSGIFAKFINFCEGDCCSYNIFVYLHNIIGGKWITSCRHFVYQYTQNPPMNRSSVSSVEKNLWGHILGSSANSKSSSFFNYFGKTEVSDCEISFIVNEDVFGLDVSMDYILALQIFQTVYHIGCIKFGLVSGEWSNLTQVSGEISSIN